MGRGGFALSRSSCVFHVLVVFVGFDGLPHRTGKNGFFSAASQATPQSPGVVSTGARTQRCWTARSVPSPPADLSTVGPSFFKTFPRSAGLTHWRHVMGTPETKFILETVGSGVALLDYDNDGWLDIYLVNGSTYGTALSGKTSPPRAALFHNNDDGTFTDVAQRAGVTNDRWGFGVAVGDYDNDGWPDLYVTNFGKNRLYRNNHDGTFTDVAEKAG